jgi:hypothetical protein
MLQIDYMRHLKQVLIWGTVLGIIATGVLWVTLMAVEQDLRQELGSNLCGLTPDSACNFTFHTPAIETTEITNAVASGALKIQ